MNTTRSLLPSLALLSIGVLTACGSVQRSTAGPLPTRDVGAFSQRVRYVGDLGQTVGTRWEHRNHGLPVTILHIQSVPQVFLYVNTPPVSDRGEPHTGEHLLLGKGRKGKELSAAEGMSLIGSTAYTSQSDVVYAWNCAAGKETFYASVARYLDALLLPDYTDEEVRREVMNLGVKVLQGDDGERRLALEEKGTIYNEMVSSYQRRWNVWSLMQRRVWGADHPNGMSSGGDPAAVREMEPHHIHDFHARSYHLSSNLGMIVALPDAIPQEEFLERLSAMLAELDSHPELVARPKTFHPIPPARPEEDRSLALRPFPSANESAGGVALLAWPPVTFDSMRERVLAEVLLDTIASGETATLYKRLIDSATREVAVDASAMFGWMETTKVDSAPVFALDGLPRADATEDRLGEILGVVHDEVRRIAALEPGSDELATFNATALTSLTEWEKNLRKQLNAPPLFGHRSSGGFWLDHLRLLDLDSAGERSVTLAPLFASIRAELDSGVNPWSAMIDRLALLERPFPSISVASSGELERLQTELQARLAGYTNDLRERYGIEDDQGAIAAYLADYDVATARLAEEEEGLAQPRLVNDVPLTADPTIHLEELADLRGYRGIFDNVSFCEVAVALDLHGVDAGDYPWLAVLPRFLTDAGVVIDGEGLAYAEAAERRATELYSLTAEFSTRPSKGRHELRVVATGLDAEENESAVEWIGRTVFDPWIAEENLPRLRDLVRQEIQATRGRLGGREEAWVNNPSTALRFQRDGLYLSTTSHHARLFHLARVDWLLMDPPRGDDAKPVQTLLSMLPSFARATPKETVAALAEVFASDKVTAGVRDRWLRPLVERVQELVGDMEPSSIQADLAALAPVISEDLLTAPSEALARLRRVRRRIFSSPRGPRFVVTGSRAGTDAILPALTALDARFPRTPVAPDRAPGTALIRARLDDHQDVPVEPVHHALVWGAGTSGVFLHSADAAGLDDLDRASLVNELAARVYGGAGPHGAFMQTWGAGLAYSNGLSTSARSGRASYYAERCPDPVETMKFVAGLVNGAGDLDDPYLAEYAIATAVAYSRASDRYEERTRALANEIEDGDTPERVAAYRAAVLALRGDETLWAELRGRIQDLSGRVLVGVGPNSRDVPGGTYLVIAPETLITRWEEHVQSLEGPGERVYRLFPRDFWLFPGDNWVGMQRAK